MRKLIITCFVLLLLTGTGYADVIGSWEGTSTDGWIGWLWPYPFNPDDTPSSYPVDDPNIMPSMCDFATVCATEGSQSLKLIAPMGQAKTLQLNLNPDQKAVFMENDTLSIDLGVAADTLGVGGIAKIADVVINAQGIGWTGQGVSLTLDFWDGSPEQTETLSFDYTATKDAIVAALGEGVMPTYIQIVIITNGSRATTPDATPAEMYFDNVTLTNSTPPPPPELLGNWEGASDGWIGYDYIADPVNGEQVPVDDPNVMPSVYDYATVCVTEGSQSLKLITLGQFKTLKLQLTPDQRATFMENEMLSVDFGIAADELGVGGFAKMVKVTINSPEISETDLDVSLLLGFSDGSPEKVETVVVDYSDVRDTIAAALPPETVPGWINITIVTNGRRGDAEPYTIPAEMYFDNVTLTTAGPAPLSSITVTSIEDTYTAKNTPDLNDGERITVQVKDPDTGWAREAYFKFDPNGVPGNIHNAELTLNAWGGSRSAGVSTDTMYAVTYGESGPWSENTLTWNNDDLVWGDALGSLTSTFVDGSFYTFDLSKVVVESDGMITIGVRTDWTGSQGNWKSSENTVAANRPQLTIYYDPQQAVEVSPVDGSTGVHPAESLIWEEAAAGGVISHEVYFGTTSDDLVYQDTILAAENISTDPNLFEWIPAAELDLGLEYFWRIDEVFDGNSVRTGEEWSFTVAAVHPDIPTLVSPADSAIVVDPVELVWNEGLAADSHDVYFSTDDTLVAALDDSVKIAGVTSPLTVTNLDLETEYFWTVQATAASGGPWPSVDVYSFTTDDFATLDNFDDGVFWIETPGTGADVNDFVIGAAPVMEFIYDDAGDVVSEASLTFAEAKDLTAATGREALAMRVYGQAGNDQEDMYVALSDGGTTVQIPVLFDGEPVDLTLPLYKEGTFVQIDLDDFAPVDLSAVTSIAIGFGDGVSEGKSGTVYIDSISVRTSRCVGLFVDGDIVDGDCIAGPNDLALLAADWLETETTVDATTASTDGLIVHFEFEELAGATSVTSSVTYDGVNYATANVVDTPILGVAGHIGNAIDMATAGHVTIGGLYDPEDPNNDVHASEVFASLTDEITVSLWCYGNVTDLTGAEIYKSRVFRAYTSVSTVAFDAVMPQENGDIVFGSAHMGGAWMSWNDSTPADWNGAWNHYAFVIDAANNFQAIYCNGVMVAREVDDVTGYTFDLTNLNRFDIGMWANYHGMVDDFRIYNRALASSEIVDLAGKTTITQSSVSAADIDGDGTVNLIDFAEVASIWLNEILWP